MYIFNRDFSRDILLIEIEKTLSVHGANIPMEVDFYLQICINAKGICYHAYFILKEMQVHGNLMRSVSTKI